MGEKGYGGEMRYLKNPKRFDPHLVLPSAKSVICVGLVYNARLPYSTAESREKKRSQKSEIRRQKSEVKYFNSHSPLPAATDNGRRTTGNPPPTLGFRDTPGGTIITKLMRIRVEQLRTALVDLAPAVETRVFVDTGTVVERAFARFSGIGWMGKNTCILNQEKGSWFFLGVIMTSLELEPDAPAADRCGSCRACLDACPTDALVRPYVMDGSRCISYLTIELRGAIPEEFRSQVGNNIFGCDICQDVCPWNSSRDVLLQLPTFSFQLSANF